MPFKGAKKFPYEEDKERLQSYEVNQKLLEGDHFEAFAIQGEKEFTDKYNRLRYIVANFNGLVAKVAADFLFGEDATFQADKNQEFIEGLVFKSKFNVQLLESAISNAACGDDVFKIRVEDNEILIEEVDPAIYFPEINVRNPRQKPAVQELAWVDTWKVDDKEVNFLVREIHTAGLITIRIFTLNADTTIGTEMVDIDGYNTLYGTNYVSEAKTNINVSTLVHIPNFRYKGSRNFFGVSDFIDLGSLQFELNNRLTKTGNILDKHSDPILAVPEGVLDKDGRVKKEALEMIELGEDGELPQYIVWNASLDNAFKQIDKTIELLAMFSETSPDLVGLGKNGLAESGRALKMRLLRTIAKTKRKQRYYTQGLQEIFEVCQLLSIHNTGVGVTYMDKKIQCTEVEQVTIKFADGVINDIVEDTDIAIKKIDAGIMSKKKAMQLLDGYNEGDAEAELEEINKDKTQFTSIIDKLQPNATEVIETNNKNNPIKDKNKAGGK